MKKIKLVLFIISLIVLILGTLTELKIFNIISFVPYQREIWHLVGFIFAPILVFLLISFFIKKIPKCKIRLNGIWLIFFLLVAIVIEIKESDINAPFYSLQKFWHIIINLIGLGISKIILLKFNKR